jgi:hypothetical protein
MEEQHEGAGEPAGFDDLDDDVDAPAPPRGLGAVGQLAAALLVVTLLVLVFIGSSAILRRVFG